MAMNREVVVLRRFIIYLQVEAVKGHMLLLSGVDLVDGTVSFHFPFIVTEIGQHCL